MRDRLFEKFETLTQNPHSGVRGVHSHAGKRAEHARNVMRRQHLLDHVVGTGEERRWHGESKRFRDLRCYGGDEGKTPIGGLLTHRWHPSALSKTSDGAPDAQAEAT
jgi:hypothetical protein